MEHSKIIEKMERHPVIAAVRREEDLDAALDSQLTTVFLLQADIFNIQSMVDKVKKAGKTAFVHMDFLEGLGRDAKAIDFLSEVVRPDGIISTKTNHVKHARSRNLFVIQRFFLLDSLSYETTIKTVESALPDMIEIMPGIMPSVIKRLTLRLTLPIIAGGLVSCKEEVVEALKAGAVGVSTGKKDLWGL